MSENTRKNINLFNLFSNFVGKMVTYAGNNKRFD